MTLPTPLQHLLLHQQELLLHQPADAFWPARRLAIYDAMGPTWYASSYEARVAMIQKTTIMPTTADYVRAYLALLTAQKVVPLWFDALGSAGMLTVSQITQDLHQQMNELIHAHTDDMHVAVFALLLEQHPTNYIALQDRLRQIAPSPHRAVIQEYITLAQEIESQARVPFNTIPFDASLVGYRSSTHVPFAFLPYHILQLIEGVLEGHVSSSIALQQCGQLDDIFGNTFEEELPAQAAYVGLALLEALKQSIGLPPFDRMEIRETTQEEDIQGEGAAAAPALKAWSGVFENIYATNAYDIEQRQAFWTWWSTIAIPQAWSFGTTIPTSHGARMQFNQTVRITD